MIQSNITKSGVLAASVTSLGGCEVGSAAFEKRRPNRYDGRVYTI